MSQIISCPQCQRQLRLPEALMGQQVKCPMCQTIFTAQPAEPPLPPMTEEARPEIFGLQEGGSASPGKAAGDLRHDDRVPTPPAGARGPWEEIADDPRSAAARRRAFSAVYGPATALQIFGILNLGIWILLLCCNVIGIGMEEQPARGRDAGAQLVGAVIVLSIALLGICFGGFVYHGANQMKNLRSYGLAMAASILAILSCTCLGLPFGIWAIVVLNDPDVKAAFN